MKNQNLKPFQLLRCAVFGILLFVPMSLVTAANQFVSIPVVSTEPIINFGHSPYPYKYIKVAGRTVEFQKDLPDAVREELRAKQENAIDDLVGVYEQMNWDDYTEASCPNMFLVHNCNAIAREQLNSNKKARLKVKDVIDKNPGTNSRYIFLAMIAGDEIKDPDLTQAAINCSTDSASLVRIEAVKIINRQEDKKYLPDLKKVLRNEQDKYIKILAAQGLAKLDDPEGFDEISKYCNDPDFEVWAAAVGSLGDINAKGSAATPAAIAKAKAILENEMAKAVKTGKNRAAQSALVYSYRRITGMPPNEIWLKYFGVKFE